MHVKYVIALPTTNHTSYIALIVIVYDRGSSTLLVSSHIGEYVGSSTLDADMLQHDAGLFTTNASSIFNFNTLKGTRPYWAFRCKEQ